MKISRKWLEDYINIKELTDAEIALKLTMSTAEVEGFERIGEHLQQVITARILAVKPHPKADKLKIATVDTGSEQLDIVCGAPNCHEGLVSAFAPVGTKLPAGEVRKAKIRGVESLGMLLSERELGLSDDHSGIVELPADTKLGIPIIEILGFTDTVFDIDNKSLTHRPDLWGHVGFARELGAIFHKPWKFELKPEIVSMLSADTDSDEIVIENRAPDLCPRYCAIVVKNVKVVPSPKWMQERLLAVGLRPINNIVDVTNFVLYELGQPMHAFDRRQIAGNKIIIRRANEGERFVTLDEREHELLQDDIVIADAERAVALGGIMGGLNSEIVDDTTEIVFESANFHPAAIRRTATRLDLRTDSAMRFEKHQDPENAPAGIWRALELLKETCPNMFVATELIDDYPGKSEPVHITTSAQYINRMLGTNLPYDEITGILKRLEFDIEDLGDGEFRAKVPSHRATKDVTMPADLVEEIGRIYGFDNIEPEAPMVPLEPPIETNEFRRFEWRTRDIFAYELGFSEVMNYSFVGEKLLKMAGDEPGKELMLRNPLASHHDRLRRSLIPGMLDQIAGNLRFFDSFAIFELGRVYLKDDRKSSELAKERLHLAASLVNAGNDAILQMKGALQRYFERLHVESFSFEPLSEREQGWIHPGMAMKVYAGGVLVGYAAALHPQVARNFDVSRHSIVLAEIDANAVFEAPKRELGFVQWSDQPTSTFELTAIAPVQTYVRQLEETISKAAGDRLVSLEVFDVYVGEPIPEGHKAVSFRLEFGEFGKTLSSQELDELRNAVMSALEQAGFPIRK